MPPRFGRTAATLDRDTSRARAMVSLVAVLLLLAWTLWFFASRVAVYAVSQSARLEIARAPHAVELPVGGRVVSASLEVGKSVAAGDPLVELDPLSQALEESEARARVRGLGPQLDRVNAEIAQRENARTQERETLGTLLAEARARSEEAQAASELADDNERRLGTLFADRLVAEADFIRARAEARQRRAAAETARSAIARIEAEQRRKDTAERIEIARLERTAADLRAQAGTGAATVERLQHEGALRRIIAPVSGTLAEVAPIRAGTVLPQGHRVATILPAGVLRVVALYQPAEALGRVRRGQSAHLRLEGFPWTRYGSVRATVTSVAGEVRDGRVRVELQVAEDTGAAIPMQHGLPGSVEIAVERLSPAALVLRAAGRRLSPPTHAAAQPPPQ